jgi:hypothetical protein
LRYDAVLTMTFRRLKFALLLAAAVWGGLVSGQGQQRPARRSQPILFSEPRYNTAMSNLNDIASEKRALPNTGNELKKPSDIFDAGGGSANFIMPPLRQLPPPNVNSKRLRELLKKREDQAFQTPEELTAAEIFKIPEFDRDGRENDKQTALERAYERMEREQAGNTNRMKGDDLFGRQQGDEARDGLAFVGMDNTPRTAANVTAPAAKPLFGGDLSSGLFPDMNKSGSSSDRSGFANFEPPEVTRARETRLQNYKELLGADPLSPPAPAGPAVNPFNNTAAATPGFSTARSLESLPGATPGGSLSTTTVGMPQGLSGAPGNGQSLAPPPAPRMPPAPKFELPKRPL